MQIINENQIKWTQKYYVVEGRSFYAGDKFMALSIWTTKEEAKIEKNRKINLNPTDLRKGLKTRYRYRYLTGMEIRKMQI